MTRFRLLIRLAFFAALLFAFVMATLPRPPQLPFRPTDTAQHVLAFLTLTVLAVLAYPRARLILTGIALSAFGALIEFVQAIPALHRDCDPWDWVADSCAIAAILLAAFVLRRLWPGLRGGESEHKGRPRA